MWLIRNLKTSTNYTVSIFYLFGINSDKSAIDEMLIDLCDLSKSGQLYWHQDVLNMILRIIKLL